MLKVIIAGSRTWSPTLEAVDYALQELWRSAFIDEFAVSEIEVVSGTASGADRAGESWARANAVPFCQFPARWSEYGKAAGMMRNQDMADYADAAVVFWAGQSTGSANMAANMIMRRKPCLVFNMGQIEKALAVKPEPVLLSSLDVEDAPF